MFLCLVLNNNTNITMFGVSNNTNIAMLSINVEIYDSYIITIYIKSWQYSDNDSINHNNYPSIYGNLQVIIITFHYYDNFSLLSSCDDLYFFIKWFSLYLWQSLAGNQQLFYKSSVCNYSLSLIYLDWYCHNLVIKF